MPSGKISLDYSTALKVNEQGELSVRQSLKAGTSLEVRENGLYAEADEATVQNGYPDGYRSNNGIETGITFPHDPNPTSKRIVAPSTTHRIFTCLSNDGSDIAVRSCDVLCPGDMYRVLDIMNSVFKYYIILKTDGSVVTAHSGVVARVPENEPFN